MIRVPLEGEEVVEPSASRPNRSERTRQATQVNKLGIQLISLLPTHLDQLDLPEELRDAIDVCQGLKAQARGRQQRLVGKILRSEDHERVREQLDRLEDERKSEAP
jgi:ribosome-associated protein